MHFGELGPDKLKKQDKLSPLSSCEQKKQVTVSKLKTRHKMTEVKRIKEKLD